MTGFHFVSEAVAREVVSMAEAINAVAGAFQALHHGRASLFPVVMAHGCQEGTRFGVKSGLIQDGRVVGLKVGSYWPGNRARKLPAHGSTTLLLDDETGYPRAVVAATHLTAVRTAAIDGVATRALARSNASRVALVGAGHQAWYELLALREVLPITKVSVWNRGPESARGLARRAREELSLETEVTSLEAAIRQADIVVTATAASGPLFPADWVRPGTHISAMGADARGKQELDPHLVARSIKVADDVAQSLTIGEFEAAHLAGLIGANDIETLGAVLDGGGRGRQHDDDITIFDSSGTALQDLAIAELALSAALRSGRAQHLA